MKRFFKGSTALGTDLFSRLAIFVPVLFLGGFFSVTSALAQEQKPSRSVLNELLARGLDPRWSRIYPDTFSSQVLPPPVVREVPAPAGPKQVRLQNRTAVVSPNMRMHPSVTTSQSEMSIWTHPTNPDIVLAGSNAAHVSVSVVSQGFYYTTNGGTSWTGRDTLPTHTNFSLFMSDPAVGIDLDGNLFFNALLYGATGDLICARSTNNGTSWTQVTIPNATNGEDKNHFAVDVNPGSPFLNNLYTAYTDFDLSPSPVMFSRSTNRGVSFSSVIPISGGIGAQFAQGVNLAVGPNGEVYATWTGYDVFPPAPTSRLGFNKSTNGGVTWGTATSIRSVVDIRGTLSKGGNSIRVNSFPSMAVDRSSGPRRGWIYIVYPEKNPVSPDIFLVRSTDGGSTWSTARKVNQDNSGKDQWFSWVSVDPVTGILYVAYYDSRNFAANDSAQVFLTASLDGGDTFADLLVSDVPFLPTPIPGLAAGYMGDYIGVSSVNGVVWPCWNDNRTGIHQAWTSRIVFITVGSPPQISVSPETLDYGNVFLAYPETLSISIRNLGFPDTLFVTNIQSDNSDFTPELTSLALPGGGSRAVKVAFNPSTAGLVNATLSIASNDTANPTVTVALRANALIPPDISVSPDSLEADLLTGASAVETVTVTNSGGSDLDFDIAVAGPGGAAAKVNFIANQAIRSAKVLATGKPVPIEQFTRLRSQFQREISVAADNVVDKNQPSQKNREQRGALAKAAGVEIFGSPANSFFAGPRTRGNLFTCTVSNTLIEHRFYMNPPAGNQLWFLVYEGAAQVGTYNLVSASDVTPAGPGEGWYSSGSINVPLVAGRFYLIVASFEQASNYFNEQGISPYPIPASFGELTAGAGWDWAPTSNFPPDPVQNVPAFAFGSPVAYYQALVTGVGTSWLSANPDSGTVPAGESLDVAVTFDATGLNGGDYYADVLINSNDPDRPQDTVFAHLHVTGAPDIAVSDTALDFGSIFTGTAKTETLVVTNPGTDSLAINNITSDNAHFTVNITAFFLNPGDSQNVLVTFATNDTGLFTGNLTITSNDPDEPTVNVSLRGRGLLPPDILVTPDSLAADLFTGEIAVETLTVANTGYSDLNFTISIKDTGATAQAVKVRPTGISRLSGGSGALTGTKADLSPFQREISADVLAQTGSPGSVPKRSPGKISSSALQATTLLLTTTSVTGSVGQALTNLGVAYDLLQTDVFTGIDFSPYTTIVVAMDGGLVEEPDVQALATAAASGKKLIMIGGTNYPPYYNGMQLYLLSHTNQQGWTISSPPHLIVTNPSHPLAAGLPSTYTFLNSSAAFYMLRVSDGLAAVATNNGDGHPSLLNKEIGSGMLIYFTSSPFDGYWSNPPDFAILQQVIANAVALSAGVSWLSANPDSGVVPAGSSVAVEITFDATGLNGGDYYANILIASNDPDEPEDTVPAHLHVTGAPDIAVSPSSLAYGSVYTGVGATKTLRVKNVGTDLLTVSNIASDNAAFSPNTTAFSLNPNDSQNVLVTFLPNDTGLFTGNLTISSDDPTDPTLPVPLQGRGIYPPVLTVFPDSFGFRLGQNDSAHTTLAIGNTGLGDLQWNISVGGSAVARPRTYPERYYHSLPKGATDDRVGNPVLLRSGGPDNFGYSWIDSDEPGGPVFNYRDISATGVQVFGLTDDNFVGPFLLGFTFNYYGTDYTQFYIASNGFIGFGPTDSYSSLSNSPIPNSSPPNNILPWCWDDLFPQATSAVYYQTIGSQLIIQFKNYGEFGGPGLVNAEVILNADGTILYQYLNFLNGFDKLSSTVGIENQNGTDGLEVVFDNSYLKDTLAVLFSANQWLSAAPVSGTVPPGGSVNVDVKVKTENLTPGRTYRGNLLLTGNDPLRPQVPVPVRLDVVGVPNIVLSSASLDFGEVYIGYPETSQVRISNTGLDSLKVSGMDISDPQFSLLDPAILALAPGEYRDTRLQFSPTGAGNQSATLTIHSNDPNDSTVTVQLRGKGVQPPAIDVVEDSLAFRLREGQSQSAMLTIENSGLGPLFWTLAIGGPGSVSAAPAVSAASDATSTFKGVPDERESTPVITAAASVPNAFLYTWLDSDAPGGPVFNWIDISGTGTFVSGLFDNNFVGPFPIGFSFNYYGTDYTQFYISSNGFIGFGPTSGYDSPANTPLPSGSSPNNILAWCWDDLIRRSGSVFYRSAGNQLIIQFINYGQVGVTTAKVNAEVILSSDGSITYQYLNFQSGFNVAGSTVGIENSDGTDGLQIAHNQSYLHDGLAILIARGLFVAPLSGTIPPGGSQDVTVRVKTNHAGIGMFRASLLVNSNDPARPQETVPVKVEITPCLVHGDVNNDALTDLADITALIQDVVFASGLPNPDAGDIDCDGIRDLVDVVGLIGFVVYGSPTPCCL